MKLKPTLALLCIVMLLTFTGCQLALADQGLGSDRLIGVYVTTEHIDLVDWDAYMKNAFGNMQGGSVSLSGDTAKYQGRLYAERTSETLTREETGETYQTMEYAFPETPGVAFFSATVPAVDGQDSYRTSVSSPGVVAGNLHLSFGDVENSVSMEGTVYVSPAAQERTFYVNPVYQSTDGSVYLTTGYGYMVSTNWAISEGQIMTHFRTESHTITENGKTKTESISVKLALSVMYAPQKIILLQMNESGLLLSRSEHDPGQLPEELAPHPETAFIVVETHKQNIDGAPMVTRSIFGTGNTSFDTYFAEENGICIQQWTQLLWKK